MKTKPTVTYITNISHGSSKKNITSQRTRTVSEVVTKSKVVYTQHMDDPFLA